MSNTVIEQAVAGFKIDPEALEAIQDTRLEIVWLPTDQVLPNKYNPNRQSDHQFELLCKSIRDDGFLQPIIVLKEPVADHPKHTIVDGFHRWKAMRALGLTTVPCVEVVMDEAQMKIATFSHNRARGSHDIQLQAQLLRDLAGSVDVDALKEDLQLADVEVTRLLEDIAPPAVDNLLRDVADDQVTADQAVVAAQQLRQQEVEAQELQAAQEAVWARKDTAVKRVTLTFTYSEDEYQNVLVPALGNNHPNRHNVLALVQEYAEQELGISYSPEYAQASAA